jgi:DNA-binding NtrC family response regulator
MQTFQRILVVDDEDAVLFSYKKLLSSKTVRVDGCMTLEKALSLIRENDYDALITDLRLTHSEGNEGMEILKFVKQYKPSIPVILLTGYGNDQIKDNALALGACGYFDKPVQITKLITILRDIGIHIDKP